MESLPFTIIGAGPAGLAAAHELVGRGFRPVMLEQDRQVGGLSKTVNRRGFRFDIGGHRFFTKNADVEALWRKTLPDDFLKRPRMSRIHYRGRLFDYPLRAFNALWGLGPVTSLRAMLSFAWRRLRPQRPETNLEAWVSNRFGNRLYEIFFRTYTEKVWGIPCTNLSADWAAQRIRNLDLGRAVLSALGIGRKQDIASIIEEFHYPRYGPGQMYEAMATHAAANGASLHLGNRVEGIHHDGRRVKALRVTSNGSARLMQVGNVVSTMPITELAARLEPGPPVHVAEAAAGLRYRSIITVNLVIEADCPLPDNWVYVHSPEVKAARLQFYKNWSPGMVPDPTMYSVGLEYFAFESDGLWRMPDNELVKMALDDLRSLGLVDPGMVKEGFVVRYPKAYPVYEGDYRERLRVIRTFLDGLENLACAGRYGQFRYNNMDHSIMTGLLAVRRLLGADVDPWAVNEEAEYLEETATT